MILLEKHASATQVLRFYENRREGSLLVMRLHPCSELFHWLCNRDIGNDTVGWAGGISVIQPGSAHSHGGVLANRDAHDV